jgi:hypothetical protein
MSVTDVTNDFGFDFDRHRRLGIGSIGRRWTFRMLQKESCLLPCT